MRGCVVAITGDNLGSHCIGGFTENFSTTPHFCRYCNITKNVFHSENAFSLGVARSTTSYNEAVKYLEENPEVNIHIGIKFNSVFNSLQYFHVCNPGLPPCLGHDLFEGVVSFDLALYLLIWLCTSNISSRRSLIVKLHRILMISDSIHVVLPMIILHSRRSPISTSKN